MYQADLERFQENYLADDEALPLVAELHTKYSEMFLCEHLRDETTRHSLTLMCEIKKELEERFLISICSTNHTIEEELRIDDLFPNIFLLIDYDRIIEMLVKKEWIDEFIIMKPRNGDWYRSRERTIFAKGNRWKECPTYIQEHFNFVKASGNTNT